MEEPKAKYRNRLADLGLLGLDCDYRFFRSDLMGEGSLIVVEPNRISQTLCIVLVMVIGLLIAMGSPLAIKIAELEAENESLKKEVQSVRESAEEMKDFSLAQQLLAITKKDRISNVQPQRTSDPERHQSESPSG